MIRFFVIRFLLPLLILFFLRALLRSVFAGVRSYSPPPAKSQQQPPGTPGGELKKDPVCGTYVSTSGSISRTVNGKVLYFCSAQCRDKYRVA
jgi:YHS domain-containing protein